MEYWLLLILLLLALAACAAPPTPLPTATPSSTVPPTETFVWFPPTATYTPFPTRAVTPTEDPRPGLGALIFWDDFSTGEFWALNQGSVGSVALGNNALTIAIAQPLGYLFTTRTEPTLSDFYVEVTASASICTGEDEYGLLLRFAALSDFYRFSLSCDGRVRLDRIYRSQPSSPQPWLLTGVVPPGAPGVSRLAVWALGDEMHFFVNDALLFTVQDGTVPRGLLGLFARSAGDTAVTVNFSDMEVWEVEP